MHNVVVTTLTIAVPTQKTFKFTYIKHRVGYTKSVIITRQGCDKYGNFIMGDWFGCNLQRWRSVSKYNKYDMVITLFLVSVTFLAIFVGSLIFLP